MRQNNLTVLKFLMYCASVLCLIIIVHATRERMDAILTALLNLTQFASHEVNKETIFRYIESIKGILFLASASVLLFPIIVDGRKIIMRVSRRQIISSFVFSLSVSLCLLCLVFYFGNKSMGVGYALRSIAPFMQETDWWYKRLLMPVFAHVLFFRGGWLYFIFSHIVTVFFLVILRSYLKNEGVTLPFWQFLSLCTSSFVIFQFQSPGYSDVLAFGLLVLVMSKGFTLTSKLSLLVFALLTHEASLFIGVVLAWRYLNKKYLLAYLLVLLTYGFVWLAGYGFQVENLLTSHSSAGMSSVQWVFQNLKQEFIGLFISFKALWLLPVVALYIDIKRKYWKNVLFLGLCLFIAVLMTFLGIDTSRMTGWAFPMILVSLQVIYTYFEPRVVSRFLSVVFLINILIPSFYIGLNSWISFRHGLYRYFYFFIVGS